MEQAYQVYTFLCSCTSMKNQFAELSQKNLVALILDRIKESTLARQVTEMIEEKLMEKGYNDNYYVYHVYKFMEDLFCNPLRNSSSVLTLMDKERMQGRTVQSYIEALRPLCRLYVQCISSNLSEQKKTPRKSVEGQTFKFPAYEGGVHTPRDSSGSRFPDYGVDSSARVSETIRTSE